MRGMARRRKRASRQSARTASGAVRAGHGRGAQRLLERGGLLHDDRREVDVTFAASRIRSRGAAEQRERVGEPIWGRRRRDDERAELHRAHGEHVAAVALRIARKLFGVAELVRAPMSDGPEVRNLGTHRRVSAIPLRGVCDGGEHGDPACGHEARQSRTVQHCGGRAFIDVGNRRQNRGKLGRHVVRPLELQQRPGTEEPRLDRRGLADAYGRRAGPGPRQSRRGRRRRGRR